MTDCTHPDWIEDGVDGPVIRNCADCGAILPAGLDFGLVVEIARVARDLDMPEVEMAYDARAFGVIISSPEVVADVLENCEPESACPFHERGSQDCNLYRR